MVVCRIHAGHLDGLGNLCRQIVEAVNLPFKGSQAFQFGVFAGRYELTADPPMAGNGHGRLTAEHGGFTGLRDPGLLGSAFGTALGWVTLRLFRTPRCCGIPR